MYTAAAPLAARACANEAPVAWLASASSYRPALADCQSTSNEPVEEKRLHWKGKHTKTRSSARNDNDEFLDGEEVWYLKTPSRGGGGGVGHGCWLVWRKNTFKFLFFSFLSLLPIP